MLQGKVELLTTSLGAVVGWLLLHHILHLQGKPLWFSLAACIFVGFFVGNTIWQRHEDDEVRRRFG